MMCYGVRSCNVESKCVHVAVWLLIYACVVNVLVVFVIVHVCCCVEFAWYLVYVLMRRERACIYVRCVHVSLNVLLRG